MKTNHLGRCAMLVVATILSTTLMAQDKLFTLEDLNFGGSNYRNMTPQAKYYTWWGDMLVETGREACTGINPKTQKQQALLAIGDINANLDESEKILRLDYASFPYPDSTIVMFISPA